MNLRNSLIIIVRYMMAQKSDEVRKGQRKTLQTIHKPYIYPLISLIFRALRNVGFAAQTLHKPYIKPYIETFQTLHKNYT